MLKRFFYIFKKLFMQEWTMLENDWHKIVVHTVNDRLIYLVKLDLYPWILGSLIAASCPLLFLLLFAVGIALCVSSVICWALLWQHKKRSFTHSLTHSHHTQFSSANSSFFFFFFKVKFDFFLNASLSTVYCLFSVIVAVVYHPTVETF